MNFTCNSGLASKLKADGRPSNVEKATFPPLKGEMSEYSEVQRALVSSPLVVCDESGKPYMSRHLALQSKDKNVGKVGCITTKCNRDKNFTVR